MNFNDKRGSLRPVLTTIIEELEEAISLAEKIRHESLSASLRAAKERAESELRSLDLS
jgi:hypothetical protein